MPKAQSATVYIVTYQLGHTCDAVGVFSSAELAVAYVQSNFARLMISNGSVQYGDEELQLHERAMTALFSGDAHFEIRDLLDGHLVWIDLKQGEEKILPVLFAITRTWLDAPELAIEEVGGDLPDVRFVRVAPTSVQ